MADLHFSILILLRGPQSGDIFLMGKRCMDFLMFEKVLET
jgi:hypothetical protein